MRADTLACWLAWEQRPLPVADEDHNASPKLGEGCWPSIVVDDGQLVTSLAKVEKQKEEKKKKFDKKFLLKIVHVITSRAT